MIIQQQLVYLVQMIHLLNGLGHSKCNWDTAALLCMSNQEVADIICTVLSCRCVSPILTVVAAMTHGRSVFVSPPDKREEANLARANLIANSTAGKSDHLAIIAAFNGYTAALVQGGRQQAHAVSHDHCTPSALQG